MSAKSKFKKDLSEYATDLISREFVHEKSVVRRLVSWDLCDVYDTGPPQTYHHQGGITLSSEAAYKTSLAINDG